MMFATTKLAALWFPDEQRALANTIGSMGKRASHHLIHTVLWENWPNKIKAISRPQELSCIKTHSALKFIILGFPMTR